MFYLGLIVGGAVGGAAVWFAKDKVSAAIAWAKAKVGSAS